MSDVSHVATPARGQATAVSPGVLQTLEVKITVSLQCASWMWVLQGTLLSSFPPLLYAEIQLTRKFWTTHR